MDNHSNTLAKWSWSQHEQSEFGNPLGDHYNPADFAFDTETTSDDEEEDELLRYAIMLSLEDSQASLPSDHIDSGALELRMDLDQIPIDQSDNTAGSRIVPVAESKLTSSFSLLSLPLEIKEQICSLVFAGEEISVSLRRGTHQKFLLDWHEYSTILLVCREINNITMRLIRHTPTTIDLRQYRRATLDANSGTISSLADLLSQNPALTSVCDKLILSQGQYIPSDELQHLIPTLTQVELYNYTSCRRIVREDLSFSGRIFEYAVPRMMMNEAASLLKVLEESLPSYVCANLVFICDTLMCIPEHDDRSTPSTNTAKGKETCIHMGRRRRLLGLQCKKCPKEKGEIHEQAPRFKTAKLVSPPVFPMLRPCLAY